MLVTPPIVSTGPCRRSPLVELATGKVFAVDVAPGWGVHGVASCIDGAAHALAGWRAQLRRPSLAMIVDLALTELWSEREVGLLFQSGVPVQNHVLAFNDAKRGVNDLRLIDLATGLSRWETAEIDKGSAMVCDDGHTLILTSKGELVLAKLLADKIDILSRVQVLGGKSYVQPVLAHGRVLCRNNEGSVVCLDVK